MEEAVMAEESLGDVVIVPSAPFQKPAAAEAGPAVELVFHPPISIGGSIFRVQEGQVDPIDHGMRFIE